MSYRFELHCHTAEVSGCARHMASEAITQLKECGYDGAAITDHYFEPWFRAQRGLNESEKCERWLSGYRAARKTGEQMDFRVILGMELRFDCRGANDYLVFGLTEEFVISHPQLYKMTPEEFHSFAARNGLIIMQAHPGRDMCTREDFKNLDGIEVFNGHPGHNSHNADTLALAKNSGLFETVGSDFHEDSQLGAAAMLLPRLPVDSPDLAKMLVNGEVDGFEIHHLAAADPAFAQDGRFRDRK